MMAMRSGPRCSPESQSAPVYVPRICDPAAQDGQANDLFGAFDFTQAPLPPLPLQMRTCP